MGYYEYHCDICGVSFNISRFRTADEPPQSAWGHTGDGRRPYVHGRNKDCSVRDGSCFYVKREGWLLRDPQPTTALCARDLPRVVPDKDGMLDFEKGGDYEHIAGPHCDSIKAYNGNYISLEAMKGINVVQCLVEKEKRQEDEGWADEEDDEEWENEGQWYLSGLCDDMYSPDSAIHAEFIPLRHPQSWQGTPAIDAIDIDVMDRGMPFHPACLEIWKRCNMHTYGKPNIDIFTELVGGIYGDAGFDRCEALGNAREQWWEHHLGDEFLAANPVIIPGLDELFARAKLTEDTPLLPIVESNDTFVRLPEEIRLMILDLLPSPHLKNLRLASRTFRSLPPEVFRNLALRELPWLYETWCTLPYSPWVGNSAAKEKERVKRLKEANAKRRFNSDQAEGSSLPSGIAKRERRPVVTLDRLDPDWYGLLLAIGRQWDKLPGLKNRSRIWRECQSYFVLIDTHDASNPSAAEEKLASILGY